ncbi:MAG: HupE/UreJ family protein [Gammaproteobacteria bacterium]
MPDILFKTLRSAAGISLLAIILCLPVDVFSDVVKPALIEISVDSTGQVNVEIRASIEALLTGINAQYKNTQEAPEAEKYDVLRKLSAGDLALAFEPFKDGLVNALSLSAGGQPVALMLASVEIPEPGYTKVPRISVLKLVGEIEQQTKALTWYYPAIFGDNAVRVRQVDRENEKWHWSEWQWIRNGARSEVFSLEALITRQSQIDVITSYVKIGFDHIIPKGLDHILFIVGLFLFSQQLRPLFMQVTLFTLAHTLTLGLSMNGIIDLPSRIVEPLIALSIAYVGIENLFSSSLRWSRLSLIFGFGMLHGLGFASVLSDFKMPDNEFMTALISFNIGVELGQIAVISLAYLLVARWFRQRDDYRKIIVIPFSLLIAATGLSWAVQRLGASFQFY